MFTREGNRRVAELVDQARRSRDAGVPEQNVLRQWREGYAAMLRDHPEITDTAVRDEISNALEALGFSERFNLEARYAYLHQDLLDR